MRYTKDPNEPTWMVLINPSRRPRVIGLVAQTAINNGATQVVITKNEDHLAKVCREFWEGNHRYMLVWGGDGTAHLVINALSPFLKKDRGKSAKAVGFLRGGSGNGIQSSLGVPRSYFAQFSHYKALMDSSAVQRTSVLRVNRGGTASYGTLFGAGVDALALQRRRGLGNPGGPWGWRVYVKAVTQVLFSLDRPLGFSISVDGKEPERITQLEFALRPHYGYGFIIAPGARLRSPRGLLWTYRIDNIRTLIRVLAPLWRGRTERVRRRIGDHSARVKKTDQLILSLPEDLPYHIDGEYYEPGAGKIEITVIPEFLPILTEPVV